MQCCYDSMFLFPSDSVGRCRQGHMHDKIGTRVCLIVGPEHQLSEDLWKGGEIDIRSQCIYIVSG